MWISYRHEAAKFGVPVILDDAGKVMGHPAGVAAVLDRLGWDRRRLATETGHSVRTVERWLQGRRAVPAAALLVLLAALEDRRRLTGRPAAAGG